MNIEKGKCLYAKCDCMNNFRKGQTVGVDILDEGILIDGVVVLSKEQVEKYFTDNLFYDSKYDDLEDKLDLLKEAAQSLIDFLNKNYDPMTIAVVREDRVDILRSEMGIPLEVRDGSEINER